MDRWTLISNGTSSSRKWRGNTLDVVVACHFEFQGRVVRNVWFGVLWSFVRFNAMR